MKKAFRQIQLKVGDIYGATQKTKSKYVLKKRAIKRKGSGSE